jgi:hypothetical protein
MAHASETRSTLFSGPRGSGLGAAPLAALCLALAIAFFLEVLPMRDPADRFYDLEAQRDAYVRAAAARQAVIATREVPAGARLAAAAGSAVQARTGARLARAVPLAPLASGATACGCRSAQ